MLKRQAVTRLGPWLSSLQTCRTPLESWLLKAWRLGMKLVSTGAVTVVKPRMMHGYDEAIPGHALIVRMALTAPGQLRELMLDDVRRSTEAGYSRPFVRQEAPEGSFEDVCRKELNPITGQRFLRTGFDVLSEISGTFKVRKGHVLRSALSRRTGEALSARPDLGELIENTRQQLSACKEDRTDDCDLD